jgi:hypothetical protein
MKKIIILSLSFMLLFACSRNKAIVSEQPQRIEIIYQTSEPKIKDLGNGWFEVTGTAVIQNITPEEARKLAIQDACKKAIECYSGVEVTGRTLLLQAESSERVLQDKFMQLISQTSQGIVLEKEVLNEEIKVEGNTLKKVVVLKVKVGKQKGEKDPYFNLKAELNKEYFKDGENLELAVIPTKDCYLTVFNICSNDSVYIIFPNMHRRDNFVKAGEKFKLPDESDEKIGLSFPVHLLPGKEEDTELIKVIATKEPIMFSSFRTFSAYGDYQSALNELVNQLIKIPKSEIEEYDLVYSVYK